MRSRISSVFISLLACVFPTWGEFGRANAIVVRRGAAAATFRKFGGSPTALVVGFDVAFAVSSGS